LRKTIYIFRHGETDYNRQGIVQGSGVDAPLNDKGHLQAEAFFRCYQHIRFDLAMTSALRRTHQTAAPFLAMGLPWEQCCDLNEISWGILEGQSATPETRARFREVTQSWQAGDLNRAMPGGESAREMCSRVTRFIEYLKARHERNILVCSHGRVMRCLIAMLKDGTPSTMEHYHHYNTGLYLVHWRDKNFHFEAENDVRHLDALDKAASKRVKRE
jgi:broad specificity phosphatase PhoE